MDIILSKSAEPKLKQILNDSEYNYIRIMSKCDSIYEKAKLVPIADNIGNYDILIEVNNFNFIINIELASQISSITISYGGLLSRDEFSIYADPIY